MSSTKWISKSLVVAKYPEGDLTGLFFGYYSLLVYQIQAVYITLFFRNRDLLTFWCCFTHLVSEILNYFLKHVIRQQRPNNGAPEGGLFEGQYGMPSQHCHCLAYLTGTINLLVFFYYRSYVSNLRKCLVAIASFIVLFIQAYARVYLKFHSINQCVVGVLFGLGSAVFFFYLGINFFLPHSDYICRLWPLRVLYFRRDLVTDIPNHTKPLVKLSSKGEKSKKKLL